MTFWAVTWCYAISQDTDASIDERTDIDHADQLHTANTTEQTTSSRRVFAQVRVMISQGDAHINTQTNKHG